MIPFPTTLATLPKSAIASGKKVLASPVHTLSVEPSSNDATARASLKRKQRPEVVLGLPGGGVQLYDVRAARLVTSYAAPPDVEFICAPVSVLLHQPAHFQDGGRRRVTVAAFRSSNTTSGVQLTLWDERIGKDVPLQDRVRSRRRDTQAGALVKIDVTVTLDDGIEKLCFVGVDEDGTIRCWDEQLESVASSKSNDPSLKTEAVFLVDLDLARKGLLKSREDITIAAISGGMQDLVISVLVADVDGASSRTHQPILRINGLRMSSPNGLPFEMGISELSTITLPESKHTSKNVPKFSLHASSGRLFQYSKKHLAVYRLTAIKPRLEHEISFNEQVISLLPISSAVLAAVTASSIEVLDSRYKAVLASCNLNQSHPDVQEARADGMNGVHAEKTRMELISFCPSLGAMVATRNHSELVHIAIEGGKGQESRPRKKLKHSTLADAVGRGMALASASPYTELSLNVPRKFGKIQSCRPLDGEWQETSQQLEDAASGGHGRAFDDITRKHMPNRPALGAFHPCPQLIDFVLTQLFTIEGSKDASHQASATLRLWPYETLVWLAQHGYLTQPQLELAHKRRGGLAANQSLEPHAIVKSVAAYDWSLGMLEQLLDTDVSFSTGELVCAMRIALQRIRQVQDREAGMKLLATGDVSMHSGSEPDAPPSEDDNGDLSARRVMDGLLGRLEHIPPAHLRTALAGGLQHADLLGLIEYLRVSVAQAGWLWRYSEAGPDDEDESRNHNRNGALPFVLLNAALDIVGSSAWLDGAHSPGRDGEADSANTLSHMRAEISAALEGVEESAYLAGLLHEVLLYARTVPHAGGARLLEAGGESDGVEEEEPSDRQGLEARRNTGPGRPVLVSSADDDGLAAAGLLPLGLKHHALQELEPDALLKMQAGGSVARRSVREIGLLKSMRVGTHTLERIEF